MASQCMKEGLMQSTQFPPESFEQLRQLTMLIRNGELDFPMGKKTVNALSAMLENPEMAAVSNIVELSQQLDISPASLTRLAKLFGFTGFNAFQSLFKQFHVEPVTFYSQSLQGMLDDRPIGVKDSLRRNAELLSHHLFDFIDALQSDSFDSAIELLIRQRRVFIFGYRQSSSVASIFRYGLSLLRNNVHMLLQADHGAAMAMNQVQKNDLIVLIGSAPHSSVTLKIANAAKDKGCQILVISDSELSPLSDAATVSFVIPAHSQLFVNSQVMNSFVVESLLSQMALRMGKVAVEKLQDYEEMLKKFQINN